MAVKTFAARVRGALGLTTNPVGTTYVPTIIPLANILSVSVNNFQYLRVGSTVNVSGSVVIEIDVTATPTGFSISLPIASNFNNVGDCAGGGLGNSPDVAGTIFASVPNDNAEYDSTPILTGFKTISVNFTYTIK